MSNPVTIINNLTALLAALALCGSAGWMNVALAEAAGSAAAEPATEQATTEPAAEQPAAEQAAEPTAEQPATESATSSRRACHGGDHRIRPGRVRRGVPGVWFRPRQLPCRP